MSKPIAVRVGAKGRVTLPEALRKKYCLEEGDTIFFHDRGDVLMIARGEDPFAARLVERVRHLDDGSVVDRHGSSSGEARSKTTVHQVSDPETLSDARIGAVVRTVRAERTDANRPGLEEARAELSRVMEEIWSQVPPDLTDEEIEETVATAMREVREARSARLR